MKTIRNAARSERASIHRISLTTKDTKHTKQESSADKPVLTRSVIAKARGSFSHFADFVYFVVAGLLWCGAVWAQVPRPCWFEQPIEPVGAVATSAPETGALQAALAEHSSKEANAQAGSLEGFIAANPGSAWVPGLRINLAKYYQERGQYSRALAQWEAAWQATSKYPDGWGKHVADYAWAHWTRLLARFARIETLNVMFKEVEGRHFEVGPLQQMVRRTRVLHQMMVGDPDGSYRCGLAALDKVAKALQGTNYRSRTILTSRAAGNAHSLKALGQVADQFGLDLVAVARDQGQELVVPSVVHWRQNHYAAIVEQRGSLYLVADPAFDEARWFSVEAINEEASGYFLAPARQVPASWRRLGEAESSQVLGHGINYYTKDKFDQTCPGCCPPGHQSKECGGPGMMWWRVSEPYLNLWLEDEPLSYQPALGDRVAFHLLYKQRDEANRLDASVFNFGVGFHSDWSSYVKLEEHFGQTRQFWAYLPGGGEESQSFPPGQTVTNSYNNNCQFICATNVNGNATNFTLLYPDGTQYGYSFPRTDNHGNWTELFLTRKVDAQGFTNQFIYTNAQHLYDPTSRVVRLWAVVDADGRTNNLEYVVAAPNTNDNRVLRVTDPYYHTNSLAYDDDNRLTAITDTAQMTSTISYPDGDSWPNALTTPYGTTSFTFQDNGLGPLGRVVDIDEPNEGRQLYAYYGYCGLTPDSALGWMPASYTANKVPSGNPSSLFVFDNEPFFRESFYWNQHQAEGLPVQLNEFGITNYNRARMRHWLNDPESGSTVVTPTATLAFERDPSPDANGNTEGQLTWFGYTNQTQGTSFPGTQIQPTVIARRWPNATNVWYAYFKYNGWGKPTLKTETYGDGSTTRNNRYSYANNDLDLISESAESASETNLLATYAYNSRHQITTQTVYASSNLSYTTSWAYDSSNRVSTVQNPAGLVSVFSYNADNRLTNVVDRDGSGNPVRANAFTWSGTNWCVQSHTDARGLTRTFGWDRLGRLTNVAYPDSTSLVYSYELPPGYGFNTSGSAIPILDRTGIRDRMTNWTRFGYDRLGRVTSITDANTNTTWFTYCGCGSPAHVTNALGKVTTISYDNAGRKTEVYDADTNVVHYTYNLLGQLVQSTDNLTTRTYFYNNQGLLTAVSNAFGVELGIGYDIYDHPTNVANADGVAVTQSFDLLGRLLTRTYPDSGVERFEHAYYGITAYTNQLTNVTRFAYDVAGRKTSEITPNLEQYSYTYKPADDLLTLVDHLGHTNSWDYNAEGLVISKTVPGGAMVLRYQYDANQRLTNRWSAAKGNTAYRYDAVGNLTNVAYASGRAITNRYDVLNRLTTLVDGAGTTQFGYRLSGDLESEDGPWANDTVTCGYSTTVPNLRLGSSLQQPNANAWGQSYGYDAAGRLVSVVSPAGTFGYQYLGRGTIWTNLALPPTGSQIRRSFDSVARLTETQLLSGAGATLNYHGYSYNAGNQRTAQVRTDNSYVTYAYDADGQLQSASGHVLGGAPRVHEQFGYGYDAAGNLHYRTNNALIQTFTPDALNQLGTITRSGTFTVTGTIVGPTANVSVSVNDQPAALYVDSTFAAAGMTLTNGVNSYRAVAQDSYGRSDTNTVTVNLPASTTYQYDANGNLTSDGQRVFDYDDENQLIRVTVANAWMTEFTYDGLGRLRIHRDKSWSSAIGDWQIANEVRYVYDGNLVLQERNANNLPAVTYTRGADLSGVFQGAGGIGGLLARTSNPQLVTGDSASAHAYYHADGNGNVTALLDSRQQIAARYLYDPYGNTLSISGPLADANTLRFSSKEWHENSGLYYYGFRFYDPYLQRWLNRDPIGEEGGINLYAFVGNGPLGLIDPFGWGCYRKNKWFRAIQKGVWAVEQAADAVVNVGVVILFTPPAGNSADVISLYGNPFGRMGAYNPSPAKYLTDQLVEDLAQPMQDVVFAVGGKYLPRVECPTQILRPGVRANKAAGDAWEAELLNNVLPKTQSSVRPQISIKSAGPSSLTVRLDAVGTDASGTVRLTDGKSSATASLTPNQTIVYPEMPLYGGTVVGEGKPPYTGGTVIPPVPVDVIRKK
jgi:RHS repeat-associated protein